MSGELIKLVCVSHQLAMTFILCSQDKANHSMIFLSHSSRDKDRLLSLIEELNNLGLDIWCGSKNPGGSFVEEMSEALKNSERLLVAWSEHARRSAHVANELHSFYQLQPKPDYILFMLLDETLPPELFGDRLYYRATGDASGDAKVIASWASGQRAQQDEPGAAKISELDFLTMIPLGPMVERHWITHELVLAYAGLHDTQAAAMMLLMKANRLRLDADPDDSELTIIQLEYLPSLNHTSSYEFWQTAFYEACKHGPRMLGALLLVQPDAMFTDIARRDRAKLLNHLRTLNSSGK